VAVVLCSGVDRAVLETRRLILEKAGHKVVTAMDAPSLVEACEKHPFDVAVIGHTLSPMAKPRVAMLVKEHCPDVKILELYAPYAGRTLEDADSWLAVPPAAPEELLERVNELASKTKSQKRKA
jgi:CheY-like chemotaxis protein